MAVLSAVAVALGAWAMPGAASASASAGAPSHTQADAAHAVTSYDALQKYLYVGDGSYLYHEQYPVQPKDNKYSYEWPFSQAHVATLDLVGIGGRTGASFGPALRDRSAGQERYWNAAGGTTGVPGYDSYAPAPYGGGGDMFYDDNEWVGLEKAQQFLMTGDRTALARAKQVFALVVSGWDTDATHADPGGVFWTQASWSQDRNTVSNMPGAELGLRLYQATHDRTYLDWAKRMYDWTNRYLLAPNGMYWDHVSLVAGPPVTVTVEKTQWSYNQGVPIGVDVLFYEVTHDPTYLQRAESVAQASYQYFVEQGNLSGQPPYFNSIYFKNLLLLESVTGGTKYRQAMQNYADTTWTTLRDPASGLFQFAGNGETQAIEQAAMVQIYATLAWPASRDQLLY
ncbi:MAG TPA: glycoside hydrolase family 76 protein [Mycobacteriales bacterium]